MINFGWDSRIRLVFLGMGALALLMYEDSGLSAVRKSQAIKLVGELMQYVSNVSIINLAHHDFLVSTKYVEPELLAQRMQFASLSPVEDTTEDPEPFQCTSEEAINFVRQDASACVEKLHGSGVGEALDLKWRLMGVTVGRGRKTFDLEYGTDTSRVVDEDTFIALITGTNDIWMN